VASYFEIPLVAASQTLSITLSGTSYQLRAYWNNQNSTWYLDILYQDGNPVLRGEPLVAGHDLLQQYGYLGVGIRGNVLFVQTDNDADVMPTYANLGQQSHLYYATP
jgi:hypothetical protein